MNPIIIGSLIGAGTGLAKGILFDEPQRRQEAKYQAVTAALSPWTGLRPQLPQNQSGNNLLQGAITGAITGQQFGQAQAQKDLLDVQTKLLQGRSGQQGSGPWDFGMVPQLSMPNSYSPNPWANARAY